VPSGRYCGNTQGVSQEAQERTPPPYQPQTGWVFYRQHPARLFLPPRYTCGVCLPWNRSSPTSPLLPSGGTRLLCCAASDPSLSQWQDGGGGQTAWQLAPGGRAGERGPTTFVFCDRDPMRLLLAALGNPGPFPALAGGQPCLQAASVVGRRACARSTGVDVGDVEVSTRFRLPPPLNWRDVLPVGGVWSVEPPGLPPWPRLGWESQVRVPGPRPAVRFPGAGLRPTCDHAKV